MAAFLRAVARREVGADEAEGQDALRAAARRLAALCRAWEDLERRSFLAALIPRLGHWGCRISEVVQRRK